VSPVILKKRYRPPAPLTALQLAAQHNYGYLHPAEVELLTRLSRQIGDEQPQPVFVNLGAGAGTSALALAEGCPHAQIITFDLYRDHFDLERQAFKRAGRLCPIFIQAFSYADHSGLELHPHLVFIDADHSQSAVAADIEEWLRHIVNGGLMVFHDYGHPNYPGVRTAVDMLMSVHEFVELVHTTITFEIKK
jgi:predicted O-methyltransferase YrrM